MLGSHSYTSDQDEFDIEMGSPPAESLELSDTTLPALASTATSGIQKHLATLDFATMHSQRAKPADLTGTIRRLSDLPDASGGFCDIYKGEWSQGDRHVIVAMKMVRFI
jgi:hypothetical protein